MTEELAKTGVGIVGDIPWGTHFCHFYETKEDLLDILRPYFKTGLENNEFCMWVIPPLYSKEETKEALRTVIPDVDQRLAAGDIEITSHTEWFLKDGVFDSQRVIDGWQGKLTQALARGYAGMRANGNEAWLTKENWKIFSAFEEKFDSLFANHRMIALCSYPLAMIRATELFDVVRTHEFAIAKRYGNLEILETPGLKQAKAEIKKLNEELERRVAERTSQLEATNEKLRVEIAERKRADEELRKSEANTMAILEALPDLMFRLSADGVHLAFYAPRHDELYLDPKEFLGKRVDEILPRDIGEKYQHHIREALASRKMQIFEYRLDFPGGPRDYEGRMVVCAQNEVLTLVRNITDRKRAEEAVRQSKQLLDLVLATLPVGVAVLDRAGDIVLVNEASKSIWGGMIVPGPERWEQSKGFWHDSGKRVAPKDLGSVRALSEGQTGLNELIDIETFDGRQKTILHSSAPIRNAEGLIVGAVVVNEDVTQRVRAEEALRRTTEQLRALTAKLESVREEESRRIGRELHDEIGSAMTSLKWDLEGLDKLCSKVSDQIDYSTLRQRINGMVELINTTSSTLQKISSELRLAILDDLGLIPAIEWQAHKFAARTGIDCQFDSSVESIDLDREKATAIFRIIQEGLTNILRHSQATKVNIIVEKEDSELIVELKDNGRGITEEEKARPSSLGLTGMQERVHFIRGRIEITGLPGKGTVLTLRVPISNQGSGSKDQPHGKERW